MTDTFISHAALSLLPGMIGLFVGYGVGYWIAERFLVDLRPGVLRTITLFPWRTVNMLLALVAVTSPILVIRLGIGTAAGWTTIAVVLFLLSLPFAGGAVLSLYYPPPLFAQLAAGLRTLLIASIAIAVIVGLNTGAGGAGGLIWVGGRQTDVSMMRQGFLVVTVLALIVDVGLGIAQWRLSQHLQAQPTSTEATFKVAA
jgi:ABC-type proline/glycine betaine transport system permease subunit